MDDRIAAATRANKAQIYSYVGTKDVLFDTSTGDAVLGEPGGRIPHVGKGSELTAFTTSAGKQVGRAA